MRTMDTLPASAGRRHVTERQARESARSELARELRLHRWDLQGARASAARSKPDPRWGRLHEAVQQAARDAEQALAELRRELREVRR